MSGPEHLRMSLANASIELRIRLSGLRELSSAFQRQSEDMWERVEHVRREAARLNQDVKTLRSKLPQRSSQRGARPSPLDSEYQGIRQRLFTLSPRQRQVLADVVSGKANKVIALELGLSEKTIESHRARLMEKMHARSFAELVRMSLMVSGTNRAA